MGFIGLLVALVATAVGTAHVIGALGPWRAAETLSGWVLAFVTQLIGVAGVVGVGLAAFRPVPLLIGAVLVAAAEVLVVRLRPGALARYRDSQRGLLAAAGGGLRTLRHPAVLLLGLLVLAQYLWRAASGALVVPTDWDGMSYHLVGPAMWIQNGRIGHTHSNIWSDVYPQGQEVVSAWPAVFMHNLQWSVMAGFPFVVLGFAAVVSLALRTGVRRDFALLAGLGFLAVPGVFAQVGTSYVDVAATATALAAFQFVLAVSRPGTAVTARRGEFRHYWLAGAALAVATSVKTSNLLTAGLVCVIAAVQLAVGERNAARAAGRGGLLRRLTVRLPKLAAALVLPSAVVSSYWYLRTWDAYGNPFWPFTMFGFKGEGTVQDLIMTHNTPQPILTAGGVFQQMWLSWTTAPTRPGFQYDERLGALGIQWVWVLLPAIAIALVLTLLRRQWTLLLGLVVPFTVMMLASPGPWWARYTLFLPAVGAICLGIVLTDLAGRREAGRRAVGVARAVVAGVLGVAFVVVSAVPMWWASEPTNLFVKPAGEGGRRATMADVTHEMRHRELQLQEVWPWSAFRNTRGTVPEGSTIAITGQFDEIRLPLMGLHMERKMVQIPTSDDLPTTLTRLHDAKAGYLALNPVGFWDTQLMEKVKADHRHFRLVSGDDYAPVFEVGDFA